MPNIYDKAFFGFTACPRLVHGLLTYRNQATDLYSKSIDWFLYEASRYLFSQKSFIEDVRIVSKCAFD